MLHYKAEFLIHADSDFCILVQSLEPYSWYTLKVMRMWKLGYVLLISRQ